MRRNGRAIRRNDKRQHKNVHSANLPILLRRLHLPIALRGGTEWSPPYQHHGAIRFFRLKIVAGVAIAVVATAALLMLGQLPPWPVVAKDDGPEMGFDSRFSGKTDRENFPSAAQSPGVKIAAGPVNDEALLAEGLRRHQVVTGLTGLRTIDPEEIDVLVRRGQDLLSAGDIAAARSSSCARPRPVTLRRL